MGKLCGHVVGDVLLGTVRQAWAKHKPDQDMLAQIRPSLLEEPGRERFSVVAYESLIGLFCVCECPPGMEES